MCEAAWKSNVSQLHVLLEKGASASLGDYDQRTPLHLAACAGSMPCVKLLIQARANLTQDRFGCLPIHDAVRSGHKDVASYLRLLDINLTVTEDVTKQRAFGLIIREGVFAMATVQTELEYFFNMGFHGSYFEHFTLAETAHLIHCLIAAKCAARITNANRIHFNIKGEAAVTYMSTLEHSRDMENHIAEFLDSERAMSSLSSMVCFVSAKDAIMGGKTPLMICHVALQPLSEHHLAAKNILNEDDLQLICSAEFLRSVDRRKLPSYQTIMMRVLDSKSAVIEFLLPDADEAGMVTVLFGLYNPGGNSTVRELFQVFRILNTFPVVLRRDTFANGAVLYDMKFRTSNMDGVTKLVSMLAWVPFLSSMPKEGRVISQLAMDGQITLAAAQWILGVGKFCFHFFPKDTPGYKALCIKFKHDPEGQAALDELYLKTMSELIQEEKIFEVLAQHIDITKRAFQDFENIAKGVKAPFYNEDIANEVRRTITDQTTRVILLDCLLNFNAHIRVTNFFKDAAKGDERTTIVPTAMAYRFDGGFLANANKNLYPEVPYAVYLIIGRGFYGFHSRFRDVARGGIRIVRSRNEQVYKTNASRLFEEAYNLAFTQQKKNKDIPEGGSKGTILLAMGRQSEAAARVCFLGYIDSLLDCMMSQQCGIHSWLPTPEILFFGPDENTAGFMDLGAKRAERRGYKFWKALTTGKSTKLGGIPHDTYGMTTNSVHQYSIRLLEQLGVDESECTKVQTGGPDGDLGSNEILISKDKTVAIVDGSGVIYDPVGLDRPELIGLATRRVPVANFNKSKLSPMGFMVLVEDLDVTLPDGTKMTTGAEFRDTFHLSKYASADLFVPCGGRPNAVHAGNVKELYRADGSAKFKYIVEGANLFFTPDARRILEASGVLLFKDASTNKGGVTSSSSEVFASLAMDPEDHKYNMCVDIGQEPPEFYQQYVQDILKDVRLNADCEFKIIWEQMGKGHSSCEASDRLSAKINFLTDTIFADLDETKDTIMIQKALQKAIPPSLLAHVGFENIWDNAPRNYLMAMVATNLASKYVYENGMDASEFKFYNYLKGICNDTGVV